MYKKASDIRDSRLEDEDSDIGQFGQSIREDIPSSTGLRSNWGEWEYASGEKTDAHQL